MTTPSKQIQNSIKDVEIFFDFTKALIIQKKSHVACAAAVTEFVRARGLRSRRQCEEWEGG